MSNFAGGRSKVWIAFAISTESKIEFSEKELLIKLESEGDYQIKAIYDIMIQKLIKRGISPKALHVEKEEESSPSLPPNADKCINS